MAATSTTDIDVLFHNPEVRAALSDLGVWGVDTAVGRNFASNLWLRCGYRADEMDSDFFPSLLHEDDHAAVMHQMGQLRAGKADRFEGTFRMRHRDGSWVWVRARYAVVTRDAEGKPEFYMGHDQDVTDLKNNEAQLAQRLTELETLRQVIADVNTSLDLNETVSLVLNHCRRVIPYQRGSVLRIDGTHLRVMGSMGFTDANAAKTWRFAYPNPQDPATKALQSRQPIICNDMQHGFPGFVQPKDQAPTQSWLGIPLIANNEVMGLLALDSVHPNAYKDRHLEMAQIFAGHVAVAMGKALLHESLRSQALTDALTGIGNRHSLQFSGPYFFEKSRRDKKPLWAMLVDIDHFKGVNDRFGHDVGDVVLQHTAQYIQASVRAYDLICRYGGEEFLVLLPETELDEAVEAAERVRLTIANAQANADVPTCTVSIGLGYLAPTACNTLSDLIKIADQALYEAKRQGRNRTVVRVSDEPVPTDFCSL